MCVLVSRVWPKARQCVADARNNCLSNTSETYKGLTNMMIGYDATCNGERLPPIDTHGGGGVRTGALKTSNVLEFHVQDSRP